MNSERTVGSRRSVLGADNRMLHNIKEAYQFFAEILEALPYVNVIAASARTPVTTVDGIHGAGHVDDPEAAILMLRPWPQSRNAIAGGDVVAIVL